MICLYGNYLCGIFATWVYSVDLGHMAMMSILLMYGILLIKKYCLRVI